MSWKLLTTREFCDKYPELNLTVPELDHLIHKRFVTAIKFTHRYKLYPPDVQRYLVQMNTGNPEAITRINNIFEKSNA